MPSRMSYNVKTVLLSLGLALSYVWSFILDNDELANVTFSVASAVPMKVANLAVMLVGALAWKKIHPSGSRTAILGVIALAGFFHTLLVFDPNALGLGVAAPWLATALRAIVCSGLFICWSDFFGELPFILAIVSIAFTFVAAPVMDLMVLALPQESLFGVCLLLPLLSVVCLACSYTRLSANGRQFQVTRPSFPLLAELGRTCSPAKRQQVSRELFPWQLVLLVATYSVVFGMSKHEATLAVEVVSFGLAGAIVLLLVVLLRKRMSVHAIMHVSLPIMLLGLLAASLADSFAPTLVQVCVNTGTALLTVFALIVVSDRAYRFGFSAVFLTSVLRAALYVGTLVGMFLVGIGAGTGADGSGNRAFLYVASLLIAAVGTAFWLKGPSLAGMFPAEDERADSGDELGTPSPEGDSLPGQISQYRSMVLARCAQLSEENRLSPREAEVLVCLARGMSIPRIENELAISANTVKTHVSHVYRKLGIHSRDELKMLLAIE